MYKKISLVSFLFFLGNTQRLYAAELAFCKSSLEGFRLECAQQNSSGNNSVIRQRSSGEMYADGSDVSYEHIFAIGWVFDPSLT